MRIDNEWINTIMQLWRAFALPASTLHWYMIGNCAGARESRVEIRDKTRILCASTVHVLSDVVDVSRIDKWA